MPEYKKFFFKPFNSTIDTELTLDMIAADVTSNNKIGLIKSYRIITNEGLRESKNAVEQNCCDFDSIGHHCYVINPAKTHAFFSRFFGPFPTPAEEAEAEDAKKNERLIAALTHAIQNWSVLGFNCSVDACRSILNNFDPR